MTLVDVRLGLRAFLIADANIVALIGGALDPRVYPTVLKQGEKRTSIVYTRISGQGDHWMQGPSGLAKPRYQIDCWALAAAEATSLANLVKERLDGYRGPMPYGSNSPQDFVTVQGIFFTDERDDSVNVDAANIMYRVSRDYFIWHREF